MKGIILAGGSGTRLHPITTSVCKQLLPVYDKPMICYPLATLMNLAIKDILIITTPEDSPKFSNLLGNGSDLGIKLSYAVQHSPKGLADALIIAEEFIGNSSIALILGDNIFYGTDFIHDQELQNITTLTSGATILAYHVNDPKRYGVVEFDQQGKAISIEEKPKQPKSNFAVTGLYFYDNQAITYAKNLKPSPRGELEITDINSIYLKNKTLNVKRLRRGFAWLDTGTPDSLLDAANFMQTVQRRQGLKIACIEEIAYRKGFIDKNQLINLSKKYKNNNEYGQYIKNIASEDFF